MYNSLEKAIHFATIAHKNQKRRNEDIDIIFHPYTVGMMLKELGIKDEYVIAGILHDIIEDTKYTYSDIESLFGKVIADNVLKVTENLSIKSWKARKIEFIQRFEKEEDVNILLLECADKLHNLISDYDLYQRIGNDIWKNSLANYDDQKWYYTSLLNIFKKKCNNDLINRYEKVVKLYFDE